MRRKVEDSKGVEKMEVRLSDEVMLEFNNYSKLKMALIIYNLLIASIAMFAFI